MARGVKLDRYDWSRVQIRSGVPNASTPGNIYINQLTGILYTRKTSGAPWVVVGPTSSVDYIDFNTAATPSSQEGRMYWNDTTKTIDIGLSGGQVTLQVGQEGHAYVRNQSGATINNGDAVYISGASGNKILIDLADNTDADTINVLGLATEDIANNANGYVTLWGIVRGSATQPINTNSYSEGDKLYLSTSGGWSNVHPASSTAATIVLGVVRRKHASLGEIHVHVYPFTIGNNFDGTMRQSIINESTGVSAAVGFTAVNDQSHWMTVGIGGSNNAVFGEAAIFYGPGYADNWYAVDGNKSHKWFVDPTDSHNNSSLSYLSMELDSSGHLTLGRGQFTSTLSTGTAPLNVTSTTLCSNLNADLLDGQEGSYYVTAPDLQMHGFVDNTETTISFNDSTYVFTLTDAGGGWSYYRDGIKYTISGNKTTTLAGSPPTADTYYIYIDATDGTLSNGTTVWNLTDSKVPVAYVQWDNSLTPKYVLSDERHTSGMTKAIHHYQHDTFSTRLADSGAISGYVINSDVDGNKQFDIAQTKIWDEDLQHTLAATTGGVDDYHIVYRTGASTWVWKQDAMPFDYTVAGYINYDNAGTMTQGQNNKFYTTYLLATNHSGLARFVTIHGQSEFDTLIGARDELLSDLTLTNLGIAEGVAIWKFIWESSSSYTSTGKCRLAVDPIPIDTNVTTVATPPGLGTMSTQDADSVAITGGDITGLTTLDVGSTVTLVGTIDDDTMATATDTTLATSESIKVYVDSFVGNSSTTEILWNNSGVIDGTDTASWDNTHKALIVGTPATSELYYEATSDYALQLLVSKDSTHASDIPFGIENGSGNASINMFSTNSSGTLAARAAVADTNSLGYLAALGWVSSSRYFRAGQLAFKVDGTPGTNYVPGKFQIDLSDSANATLKTRYEIQSAGTHIWYGGGATPTELLRLDSSGNLTLNSTTSVNAILDEDDMAADSATSLATQQSIKAYVDSISTSITLDYAYDAGGPGAGRAVTVDSGAITLTVPNTSNNAALEITQSDTTNNPVAMSITNAGTGSSIYLAGAGTREILSDAGNLSIRTSSSGNINITSAANINITGNTYISDSLYFGSATTEPSILGNGSGALGISHNSDISSGNFLSIMPTAYDFEIGAGAELTASSGTQKFVSIYGAINQSGTANYTLLEVRSYEKATGSGNHLLLDLQAGKTSNSKFCVTYDGFIGVNQDEPTSALQIEGESTATTEVVINGYSAVPAIYLNRANGTQSSPSSISTEDLGGLYFGGYTGAPWTDFAAITATGDVNLLFHLYDDGGRSGYPGLLEVARFSSDFDLVLDYGGVGIGTGTDSLSGDIHIREDQGIVIYGDSYGSTSDFLISFKHGRGTYDSKAAIQDGDDVFEIRPFSYTGTQWIQPTSFKMKVSGTVTTSSVPGEFVFGTTSAGSGSPVTRMTIGSTTVSITLPTLFSSYIQLDEISDPGTPASNKAFIYAADDGSGNTKPYFENSATKYDLTLPSFKEEAFLPINWGNDGSSPPAPTVEVVSGNATVQVRNFDSSSTEDIVIPWKVPADIVTGDGITFNVTGVITNATAPASGEGVSFKLSGYSVGTGDAMSGTFGTEVESKDADLYTSGCTAQYDMFHTADSTTVTVTNLAAGEIAFLHFERDTADSDDDYGQDVGIVGITIKYTRQTVGA